MYLQDNQASGHQMISAWRDLEVFSHSPGRSKGETTIGICKIEKRGR